MKDIRILLCEDDPSLGRLLSDYLKAKGGSYRSIAHMRSQMTLEGVVFKGGDE